MLTGFHPASAPGQHELDPRADYRQPSIQEQPAEARGAVLLAAFAGFAAVLASLLGFVPGIYRDPPMIIAQSHGYDLGNLVVVLVLELALVRAARGSVRGRLVAVGALGCLFYTYVTYAFEIVLNPATPLYIAVLACAGWSFVRGIARFDDGQVEQLVEGRLARRTSTWFLVILGLLFGATWLSQIGGSITSGKLPSDLVDAGWPMNPIYVLDLGFALPLALLAALRLARKQRGGARMAIPFLIFAALLAVSILLMVASGAVAGQPVPVPMIVIFVTTLVISTAISARALVPGRGQSRR